MDDLVVSTHFKCRNLCLRQVIVQNAHPWFRCCTQASSLDTPLPAGFDSAYTITGCKDTHTAHCGVFRRVLARCTGTYSEYDGCLPGLRGTRGRAPRPDALLPGSTDPSLCNGAPIYQLGGVDGPVLYRYRQGSGKSEWVVGTSEGLQCRYVPCCRCSVYSVNHAEIEPYLRSSWTSEYSIVGIGPPTLAAYNNGPNALAIDAPGDGWVEYIRTPDGRLDRCESNSNVAVVAGAVSPKQQLQSYHVLRAVGVRTGAFSPCGLTSWSNWPTDRFVPRCSLRSARHVHQ